MPEESSRKFRAKHKINDCIVVGKSGLHIKNPIDVLEAAGYTSDYEVERKEKERCKRCRQSNH